MTTPSCSRTICVIGPEGGCPSFGVNHAKVRAKSCASPSFAARREHCRGPGCAHAPDAAHRLCPAADDAAGDGAGPSSHHRGGGASLQHFPQPPDEGGADAGAGRFHRRAARPRWRATARASGRRHQPRRGDAGHRGQLRPGRCWTAARCLGGVAGLRAARPLDEALRAFLAVLDRYSLADLVADPGSVRRMRRLLSDAAPDRTRP